MNGLCEWYRLGFRMGPEYERAFNGVVFSFHIKEERFELIDSSAVHGLCYEQGLA